MKKLLILVFPLLIAFSACEKKPPNPLIPPDPSLELGQLATFHGCDPERSYIIIGYREKLEGETKNYWDNQAYVVFLYINDHHDIKQAVIHKNSVQKK